MVELARDKVPVVYPITTATGPASPPDTIAAPLTVVDSLITTPYQFTINLILNSFLRLILSF